LTESIPGNKRFIELIKLIMDNTNIYVKKSPLFILPTELDTNTMSYLLSQPEFAKYSKTKLQKKLEKFPIEMTYIHEIQIILSRRFRSQLHNKWIESIVRGVEAIIKEDFHLLELVEDMQPIVYTQPIESLRPPNLKKLPKKTLVKSIT
jgi:hypothetical protein